MFIDPIDNFPYITALMARGINYVSALQEISHVLRINYLINQDVAITDEYDWGTGFKLKNKDKQAFVSLNRNDTISSALFEASSKLLSGTKSNWEFQQQLDYSSVIKTRVEGGDLLKMEADLDHAIDIVKSIGSQILEFDQSFKFSINLELSTVTKIFQSSEYKDLTQRFDRGILTIDVFSLNSPNRNSMRETIGGINREYLNWELINEKIQSLLRDYSKMIMSSPPSSGKYAVILKPDTTFSLIHETIGHAVEADQVINGVSYLSGSMGYRISSPLLNITDDPNLKTSGWLTYDDEGIKSQGTQIVEDGILTNFLHNLETAEIMGTSSTGNARATTYISPPEPRQTNLFIEPGDVSFEEMVESMRNGIIIGNTNTASTSIYSGEFTISTQNSYLVSNGEVSAVLGPTIIADNALQTLSDIESISKSYEIIPSLCLKGNSRVYIGGLAPYLQIKEIVIR